MSFNHCDNKGGVIMADISARQPILRRGVTRSTVRMQPPPLQLLMASQLVKGTFRGRHGRLRRYPPQASDKKWSAMYRPGVMNKPPVVSFAAQSGASEATPSGQVFPIQKRTGGRTFPVPTTRCRPGSRITALLITADYGMKAEQPWP